MNEDLIGKNLLKEIAQKKIVIYQILVRLFGNNKSAQIPDGSLEENGVGKFSDINDDALSSLFELGITHIWYTGIIEHAVLTDYRKYGIFLDYAEVVKGKAGSPYAIKDYYDVDPDLAVKVEQRMQEFESLVQRTHNHQLKVIIDFVPNHLARIYHSDVKPEKVQDFGENDDPTLDFSPDNNFYYLPGEIFQAPKGYFTPPGKTNPSIDEVQHFYEIPAKVTGNNVFKAEPKATDWYDTVKLNYGVDLIHGGIKHFDPIPDTWIKMRDILLFWASKGVDGFRCDMAEMIPVEFWEWVIPQLKAYRNDILFIAEIYKPDRYRTLISRGKFDFLYDKATHYETLRSIIEKKGNSRNISKIWRSLYGINHRMLRFLENHDEQRIASPFFAGDPFKGLPAVMISCFLFNGPVMIYFGQEVGESAVGMAGFSGDDGRTSIFDYSSVPSLQRWMNNGKFDGGRLNLQELKLRKLYHQILNISKSHPAVHSNYFFDLHDYNISLGNEHNDYIYYFLRFTHTETLLIVVNFSDQKIFDISINIPRSIGEHDLFSDKRFISLKDLLENLKIPARINVAGDYGLLNLKLLALACHVLEF